MMVIALARRGLGRFGKALLPLLLLVAGAACDGDNLYRTLPTGGGGSQTGGAPPLVEVRTPTAGQRVAVRDSMRVDVLLRDPQGLRSLELTAFAVRGDPQLGTETRTERFAPKRIDFDSIRVIRDTTVTRYLLPSADTLPDARVVLVATATDLAGNVAADTVLLSVGGPRLLVISPAPNSQVRAGSLLRVRVAASSPADRIDRLTLELRGGTTQDVTLEFETPVAAVDTTVAIPIPANASGDLRLRAVVRTISNETAFTDTLTVRLQPAVQDNRAPAVTFSVTAPARAEQDDSVSVTVSATDSTQVARVGVTVLAIHRLSSRTDTLEVLTDSSDVGAERATFSFPLESLRVPFATDTSTVRLEVTGWARDAAGNCAAATVPNTPLSEACRTVGGVVFANRAGARTEVLVVRGTTVALETRQDVIADLASDGERLYLSNITRNRLDVIDVATDRRTSTVSVGSRPWGLAFNRARDTLYVANSGGTNISVVLPGRTVESTRIQTPNVKLFDVAFQPQRIVNPDTTPGQPDSITSNYPTSVTRYDYSDRPQYIGVTQNGNLVYSTRPTGAAPDGTIRIYRKAQQRLEIVTQYAEERVGGKLVIANADSVFLIPNRPFNLIQVCPRNRSRNESVDRNIRDDAPVCLPPNSIDATQDLLEAGQYDTEFFFSIDINEVGLQDTTFVAVSGDHSTVAFGEGGLPQNARVIVTEDRSTRAASDPLVKFGEIRDIVGNTAERVIGLALNADGSLGVARGQEAYYFDRNLRLQGIAETGSQSGGVEMHPLNRGGSNENARSFVSGVEANGLAFIDVIDTFHFRRVGRIFMRDPVTGPIRAVRTANGTLKIYAVTARGVVALTVQSDDL